MSNKIEGIPDGWEPVRFDYVNDGESYLGRHGEICLHASSKPTQVKRLIIRKIEKPKQYRAFANAKEAEPFFDCKLKYKQHDESVLRICFLSNKGVHVSKYDYTYEEAFDVLECMDRTPFGVEVTE